MLEGMGECLGIVNDYSLYLHARSCLMLCDPKACSPPVFSVHGIFQARILKYVVISSSKGFFPTLRSKSCLLPGRPIPYHWATRVASLSPLSVNRTTLCDPINHTVHRLPQARILDCVAVPISRGIFPTQGLNPGLLHCRQIFYQLSHKGSHFAFKQK